MNVESPHRSAQKGRQTQHITLLNDQRYLSYSTIVLIRLLLLTVAAIQLRNKNSSLRFLHLSTTSPKSVYTTVHANSSCLFQPNTAIAPSNLSCFNLIKLGQLTCSHKLGHDRKSSIKCSSSRGTQSSIAQHFPVMILANVAGTSLLAALHCKCD